MAMPAEKTLTQYNPQFAREQIELIKNTVAKGATDDELKMFLYIAEKYNLDPFLKEIWFIKRVKKVKDAKGNWDYPRRANGEIDYSDAETVIMTSRDGYLKAAQQHQDYQGLISFVVREGDEFEVDAENYRVVHKFSAKRGKILGAWAKCDRRGRMPVVCYVDFEEYRQENSPIWRSCPSAMIQKVAEAFVLKRQFNINGLVTQEEMPVDYNIADTAPVDITPKATVKEESNIREFPQQNSVSLATEGDPNKATIKQKKKYYAMCKEAGLSDEEAKLLMQQETGKTSSSDLTKDDIQKLFDEVGKLIEAKRVLSGQVDEDVATEEVPWQ